MLTNIAVLSLFNVQRISRTNVLCRSMIRKQNKAINDHMREYMLTVHHSWDIYIQMKIQN